MNKDKAIFIAVITIFFIIMTYSFSLYYVKIIYKNDYMKECMEKLCEQRSGKFYGFDLVRFRPAFNCIYLGYGQNKVEKFYVTQEVKDICVGYHERKEKNQTI
jgi:hypothetical protein